MVNDVLRLPLVTAYTEPLMEVAEGKEIAMIESWMGVVVGAFVLAIATTLVIGHYRREHLRERLLRRMDHRRCWDQSV